MVRKELIDEVSARGMNCCQAVCLAFEEEFSVDREELMVLAAPFGGGLGYFGLTCGALAGAVMVFSNHYGSDFLDDKEYKKQFYAAVKEMSEAFEAENGAATCDALKKLQKANLGYSCRELKYRAVDLAERYIEKYKGELRDRKAED